MSNKIVNIVCEMLRNIYGRDKKIKKIKLQNVKNSFETLRMSKDETIEDYLDKVSEVMSRVKDITGVLVNNDVEERDDNYDHNLKTLIVWHSRDLTYEKIQTRLPLCVFYFFS